MTTKQNFLSLPTSFAGETKFPPGTSVIFTSTSDDLPKVLLAQVLAVGIDLHSPTREDIYQLNPTTKSSFLSFSTAVTTNDNLSFATEDQLQFAPGAPVWLSGDEDSPKIKALVLGSSMERPSTVVYSVQEIKSGGILLHNVTSDRVYFRASSSKAMTPSELSTSEISKTIPPEAIIPEAVSVEESSVSSTDSTLSSSAHTYSSSATLEGGMLETILKSKKFPSKKKSSVSWGASKTILIPWQGKGSPVPPKSSCVDNKKRNQDHSTTLISIMEQKIPKKLRVDLDQEFAAGTSAPTYQHSVCMILPIDTSVEFYRDTLLGRDGSKATRLCKEFDCTLQLWGTAPDTRDRLQVRLRGNSYEQLQQCQLEMERILVQSVHPRLRAYTLFHLGRASEYRIDQKNVVQTMNPFPGNTTKNGNDKLCWMTKVKIGPRTDLSKAIFGKVKVQRFLNELRLKHTKCTIDLVGNLEAPFHAVRNHLMISGPEVQDVLDCQHSLFALVRYSIEEQREAALFK